MKNNNHSTFDFDKAVVSRAVELYEHYLENNKRNKIINKYKYPIRPSTLNNDTYNDTDELSVKNC